ncbi:MAG: DUF1343 domain-containing protein [Polyangiaceae bacterium]
MIVGLDRLASDDSISSHVRALAGAKVALLAHPASVDRNLRHVRSVLGELGIRPRIIFGPEHGYGGEAQDMIGVDDARDRDGTVVRSLYGESYADLVPRDADWRDVDTVLVDLQDVGARYYTFVWTAVLVLREAAKRGVRMVVLDRPNPLGEGVAEGRPQDPAFRSFVGLECLPVRHALTLGGVVAWRAVAEGLDRKLLTVVRTKGLAADAHADAWGRAWVAPSPNMPTFDTAIVYPGGCLLEGTNLSEGRGTTRPFEIFGAPWLDGERLATELAALGLPGFVVRPVTFLPMFQKHARTLCGGVQIHPTDRRTFRSYGVYLAAIALAARQRPADFRFRTEKYEFVDHIPAFDLLTGSARAREAILGGEDVRDLVAAFDPAGADGERTLAEARDALAAHAV